MIIEGHTCISGGDGSVAHSATFSNLITAIFAHFSLSREIYQVIPYLFSHTKTSKFDQSFKKAEWKELMPHLRTSLHLSAFAVQSG